jgi:hypothetical protein
LANAADVFLSTGAIFDLNFAGGPDVIDSLFIDGVSQAAGIWGAVGSGALFTSPLITGAGTLQVTTFIAPPLPGDYNGDHMVDAADCTVWRDTLSSTTDLRANGDDTGASMGIIDQADYEVWKTNFGASGSGSGAATGAAVPEPGTLVLLVVGLALFCFRKK